jgi:hypothetical protein
VALLCVGLPAQVPSPGLAAGLEACVGPLHPRSVRFGAEDLGYGVVLWENAWAAEGFTLDMSVVDCASGETVFARTWTEFGTESDQNVRTEARAAVLAALGAGFDGGRIEAALQAVGAPTEFYTDTREDCACAVAYPDLRGDKTPFVQ